ncbi:beta-subunit of adaptor protein complex 3, protein affected trafficking 2, WEAK ACID TOLERANT 1 [Hibiscus trionum]|uniref:AP-3 complex subunit beta n=1 Tax=Hibiscus trionum TaxID=183268 RepID=A0A9W7I7D0_HIBTR|nr:beta-subunit of adaptor protein complex 3, protein affected trafficking 2, WEAK ACID TOLERANT 1 [Hibiscus trionum]
MFPQFGATADTLSKASTMVFRIGTDAHLYDDPDDVSIAPLLDSKFDSEKCEALKRLLALIAQGIDVSNYFPQVVKNVASQSLEVKKLVYLYLLHYAEKRPNEALLSINYFQKDLGDPNPLVRAWALRTMAGIRLHVISPLVLVAVGKCARDPSVYVRKCAANALPKLHDLRQEEHALAIEEIVGMLLNDHSPAVVGAAAAAFASVCPYNLSLISKNYRKLCEILPDVEEWGQIALIGILLRYVIARHGLVKESIMFSLQCTESSHSVKDGSESDVDFGQVKESTDMGGTCDYEFVNMVSRCYIEGPDEYLSRSSSANRESFELTGEQFTSGKSNDDVKILLYSTSPLLWSNNSAVVLAAAGVHWVMAPKEDVKRIIKPLLFLLRSSNASKYVVLCNIQVFAKAMPSLFAPYYEDFFICSSESYQVKALKLEILSSVATDLSISSIFKEFQDYIRDPDRRFASDTVAAIGLCAQRLPKMAHICVDGLLALTREEFLIKDFGFGDQEAGILTQAVMSIKSIIKQDPPSHEKVIIQLVRSLDSIKVPAARAMVIWMVGEYSSLGEIIPRMLNTVLKYLAWCFTSEALETKLQILNTVCKVLVGATEDLWTFKKIFSYLVELAECDLNYDVRDRARFLKKLPSSNLVSIGQEEGTIDLPEKDLLHVVAECILGRQTRKVKVESFSYRFYLPGSLSQIVLHAAPGYEPLPKPCSLLLDDLNVPAGTSEIKKRAGDYSGTDDDGTSSEGSDDESASDYDSQHSVAESSGSGRGDDSEFTSEGNDNADPLIQISDIGNASENQNGVSQSCPANLGELMSDRALESWLDEQSGSSNPVISEQSQVRISSARISLGDVGKRVKPKCYSLLDPATSGNGLKVDYSFSSEVSSISHLLVCIEVFFKNCSSETISEITLVDEDSNRALDAADKAADVNQSSLASSDDVPTLVPMESIASLEPGQTTRRILQVRFHHHLLPLKLALYCDGKKLPIKLRPDIGYFVKPLPMDVEVFIDRESRLPGMFEYTRSCAFTDHIEELDKENGDSLFVKDKFLAICESLALKMLSNANLCLVSVDMPVAANLDDASGLRLRFSSEILSSSIPCLITITVEGKCSDPLNLSIKVNCEETVFGLNLLNRIANFLVEPTPF